MNHVLELDEETFTATVEPGVVLEDFQAYVESKGLFYPPIRAKRKPPSAAISVPIQAVCVL